MHRRAGLLGWLLAFFFVLIPTLAFANVLKIEDVDLPKDGDSAEEAKISIYFDLRQGDQMVMSGVKETDCSLVIDDKRPVLENAQIREFVDGDKGVGIIFIFPIAKNYSEESFAIRSNLITLVQRIDRKIDMVNAIPYDTNPRPVGWTRASEALLSRALGEMQNTTGLEPNLFQSFNPALAALESLQNVSHKYLVLISDAEGSVVGDQDHAIRLVSALTDELKKNNITPIVIGYSPDGQAGMSNVHIIKRIATNTGGLYLEATTTQDFQHKIQHEVYDYIYKRYLLDATINMDGDNYLEAGKYAMQLVVKTGTGEEKASTKIQWPNLSKNHLLLWIFLSLGLLLGIGVAVVIIIKRNQVDEEEEFVDQGPQEVSCATCGKTIPQELYGFNGEFCLSGGLPDCPYYQMPDRGKIQITRGRLADVTFFIKKDLTTIGSYSENDVYLNDKTVSRKHAAIKTDEGKRYEIRDFGSSNGLYINDERTERKFLRDGDKIRFGTVETVFKLK